MNEIKTKNYTIIIIKTGPLENNCYLIFDEQKNCAIIDFAKCDEQIIKIFKKHDLNLKFILLTHGHFDHIMGLKTGFDLLKQTCPVLISETDKALLNDCEKNASKFMGLNFKINLPNIQTFSDNACFELNSNLKFVAISTPGHTKGSFSFILNNEVIFTGDALFKNSVGRTDMFSGSETQTLKTIEKFKTLNENLMVLPGHGPSTTLKNELINSPIFN